MFKTSELYCSVTNLLIDSIVDKAGLSSRLASDIKIIRENHKLQNLGHVNVETSHKIFYALLCYAQSCFTVLNLRNNLRKIQTIYHTNKFNMYLYNIITIDILRNV